MRPLVVTTFLTLDGVMQAPGGPDEDPLGGFAHGGWLVPFYDDDMDKQIQAWFAGAEDFLLGRGTYEIFYEAWPKMISDDPVSQALNFKPKHVASRSLASVEWETADLIQGDVGDAVGALKARDGGRTAGARLARADPDAARRGPRGRAPPDRLPGGGGSGQAAVRLRRDPGVVAADGVVDDVDGRPDRDVRASR